MDDREDGVVYQGKFHIYDVETEKVYPRSTDRADSAVLLVESAAQKKLQALMADPTVEVWALDEVHFRQHGSRCRMWIPP